MKAHLALAGAAVGAWWAPDIGWWILAIATAFAVLLVRTGWSAGVFALAMAIAAGSAVHATSSFDFPDAGPFDQWVTLVDDPRASGPVGIRVTVKSDGRRLTATAHGAVAGQLDNALSGERVRLQGSIRAVSLTDERSLQRHIVGRITVDDVIDTAPAAPVAAGANEIRRLLSDGAGSLSRTDHTLFLGMVIGDDRGQSAVTADDFRAAGLGHLLVVSGQNVAFVLAVAMPVAGRLRPAGRALVLFAVLGVFAILTRFEPSVLRATAMAGVGIGASALGKPVGGRTGLSWAAAGLLLIDPFLVRVVAFQLSAAATAGIVWWSRPIADRMPGPPWLTVPMSTTVAAQLAVSPLLLSLFGPLPLASLPANLLAGPASGAVMIWGCTGGLLAGALGGDVAAVLHWPTRALLWWVGGVARVSAAGPAATLAAPALVIVGVSVAAMVWVRHRLVGLVGSTIIAVVLTVAIAESPTPPPGEQVLGDGVEINHTTDGTVVILDNPVNAQRVLERLRMAGVRRPSLVLALDGDRADADAAIALRSRFGPVAIGAPPLHRVPGARTVRPDQVIEVGDLSIVVEEVDPRLSLAFLPAKPPR